MEIYADVFFALNFFMDLLIFWITAKLLRKKIQTKRILFGVFIMSVLHCLLILDMNTHYNFWFSILVFILGIFVVFRPNNFFALLKSILITHIVAFSLGGLTMALIYYINFYDLSYIIDGAEFGFRHFSFKVLLASTCIAFVFIKFLANYLRRNIIARHVFCDVKICLNKKQVFFNVLVDTGNFLCDQKNKMPILIVEFDSLKNIFSDEIKLALSEKDFECLCNSSLRFTFTPFKSIGNKNGVLICFKPDLIRVFLDKREKDCEAIVGICDFKISDDYHGLISPDLLP